MKNFLVILFAAILLIACSNNPEEIIVEPDQPFIVLNTGKLLSMDGGYTHLSYSYDAEGRVVFAEHVDSVFSLVKQLAEYQYEGDRIYIKFQRFAELPNGEHDPYYHGYCHYDTLFLVGGRVDSLAGYRPSARFVGENSHFFKFRYNERGELISIREDNVKTYPYARFKAGEPWYTEMYTLEWQDGNICKRTCIIPQTRDTTVWNYRYSELAGSLPGGDPRNVLFDLVPLISTGYLGADCQNLLQSVESEEFTEQIEYILDERQMVCQTKSTINFSDGLTHYYNYQIKWYAPSVYSVSCPTSH
jgi:hypothetical protein